MKKEIEFNADDLVKAVEETRDHVLGKRRITMRTTDVQLPPRTSAIKPAVVAHIRNYLNLSQSVFAQLLNVPTVTAVSWEKGRRHPSGAALRLLQVAQQDPEILMTVFSAISGSSVAVNNLVGQVSGGTAGGSHAVRNAKAAKAKSEMALS